MKSSPGRSPRATGPARPVDGGAKLPASDVAAERPGLQSAQRAHGWDSTPPKVEAVDNVVSGDVADADNDSPYEEVRAAVRNADGGEVANTLRAWILGLVFVTSGTGLNMFLSMRSPAIRLPAIAVQLLVYPLGRLWARLAPTRVFTTFGLRWNLNTGPFTIKEHAVVALMANASISTAYSSDALVALQGKSFFNANLGWAFSLLFSLSSQLIGISLCGLFRRFLVWPAAMMWPSQFAITSLFYALHDRSKNDGVHSNGWTISRYRWFAMVAAAMFCYYWIPGVLWQGLSVFSFLAWIRPNSVVVNQLFGGVTGLSLIPITFDWTYVTAFLDDPLLAPTSAHVNTLVGLLVFVVATTIGITYSGAMYADHLPMVTLQTYDNKQTYYNVSRILGDGLTFDEQKYKEYSPVFLSPALALNYGLSLASLTAALVHTGLYHGKDLWHRLRAARHQEPDVHMRLMARYDDTPDWWYVAMFALSASLGLAAGETQGSALPWWSFVVSILVALVFMVPITMILAVSNIRLGLNIIGPFLAGFMIPGRPVGVMMFNVITTVTVLQAQTYSGDLKMAHYMKIPPKTTFWCQVVATVWAVLVQIAVMRWMLGHIDNICDLAQANRFSCPNGRAFFASSVVWGVLGPRRMFGAGSMYSQLNWFWLVGAGLPVVLYVLRRRLGVRWLALLDAPVMLGATAWLPPGTPLSYASWAIVGLVFNKWIRGRWRGWWRTYNYTTAAALDVGLILGTVVVFFAITLPGVKAPRWWGNVAVFETLDATGTAVLKTVPDGRTFGPATW